MDDRENDKRYLLMLILSMVIWGSVGLFRKAIPLSSAALTFVRGASGALFLILFVKARGGKVNAGMTKKQIAWFALAGMIMAFNWIFLFDAYSYTSVAVATLCYYMMPIFVTFASVFLFDEKLTPKKLVCILVCAFGMLLVTGVLQNGLPGAEEAKGILLGLAAAVLYSCVILMNKKVRGCDPYEKTITQLAAAAVIMVPYVLLTEDVSAIRLTGHEAFLLFIVAAVHTGVAYALYFGSIDHLRGQTVAIFSYLDPIVACILSAVILGEPMTGLGIVGVILVLGAAIVSEL